MSTPIEKKSHGNQKERSDVLSLLLSIDSMFEICQCVLNIYTQSSLLLSITTEAQMLLMKLQVMKDRWGVHLPFKEACSIDFYDWSKKIEGMSKRLEPESSDTPVEQFKEYCPSKHFVLDLYSMLPDNVVEGTPAYYKETDISRFISTEEKIQKQISRNWTTYKIKLSEMVADQVEERVGNVLKPLSEYAVKIKLACAEVLRQLAEVLSQLDRMPHGTISREMFSRLAERVIGEQEYGGRKAQDSARRDADDLKNKTPDQEWEHRRDEEIAVALELLTDQKYGRRLPAHLGRDCNIKGNMAKFGKFLNSVRRDISKEELADIIEQLYLIHYLREDKEQEAVKAVSDTQTETNTDTRHSAKDANTTYRNRKASTPRKPHLPKFFNEKLAANEAAVESFYETLHHCGFYIGRPLLPKEKKDPDIRYYEGWKWSQLREAFVRLGFFQADSSKKGFAQFLEDVFPDLTATNIQRGFNSRGGYVDSNATSRIIKEMMAEFKNVADYLKMS